LVALLASAPGAASASGAPLSMTFTEARANVGVQLADAALLAPPATAPFAAQLDASAGAIGEGTLAFPAFSTHITEPIDADVTVNFELGPIAGSFDAATGALALQGEAVGTLVSEGRECKVATRPALLTLTTAGTSGGADPRAGVPFTGGLGGPGAIAGEWSDMHAAPIGGDVAFCEDVEARIGGPGGIWLAQAGVLPPPPPAPGGSTTSPGGSGPPPIPGDAQPTATATACTVPSLRDRTPVSARAVLRAAGCRIGRLIRRRRGQGGGGRPLVVRSSRPAAGTTTTAAVRLRLAPRSRATSSNHSAPPST
jgi:hypothetical protein